MFVGVGAARVRDLFSQAEAKAPCIVFIDELDALGKMRVQSPMGSHDEREQTLNQLLAEMDGFDPRKAIIIMAATNRPEVLDPALLRPGRFDRQVLVDKPDISGPRGGAAHSRQEREARARRRPDARLRRAPPGLPARTWPIWSTRRRCWRRGATRPRWTMADFDEAIDRLIAGLEKKRVMNQKEREIVAYHESGHAMVASALPGMDPVHKISIVPRGFGALGYTMQLPTEDRYLMQKQDLLNQMAVLLGGRSAEEVALGEISTGAQNDLQRATDLARSMVTEWGMSERVGVVHFDQAPPQPVPRRPDAGRARPVQRGHRAADRRRGQADRDARAPGSAPHPARSARAARTRHPAAAREGSDGGRRAAPDDRCRADAAGILVGCID